MKRCIVILLFLVVARPFGAASAEAGPMCPNCREGGPYGDYCAGPRWGWYGSRRGVETVKEANGILQDYFSKEGVTVGRVVERQGYFEADILDGKGKVMDRVIVNKRNGRIRSIR